MGCEPFAHDEIRTARAAPTRELQDDGAQLVLPSHEILGVSPEAVRRASELSRRHAPQRDPLAPRPAGRHLDHARASDVGDPSCPRRAPGEQGTWVWSHAELPHCDRFPTRATATAGAQLHVIGKDITRLHAVICLRCFRRRAAAPRARGAHGSYCSAASGSASSGVRLISTKRWRATAPTPCAAFCCAKCRSTPTHVLVRRFDERYNSDLANSPGNREPGDLDGRKYCEGVVPAYLMVDLDAPTPISPISHGDGRQSRVSPAKDWAVMATVTRGNEFAKSSQPGAGGIRRNAPSRVGAGGDRAGAGALRHSSRAVHAEQGSGAMM